MRVLLLPFFLLRLVLVVSPTLVRSLTLSWPPLTPLFTSIIFCWLVLGFYLQNSSSAATTLVTTQPDTRSPQQLSPTLSTLEKEIKTWETVVGLQPTHRDALINLALLYDALGNHEKSQEFWTTAQALDPNNEVFTQ